MFLSTFFGEVTPPAAYEAFDSTCGSGLITFANISLKLVFAVAGLFALWKFIQAGFTFMNSSGDPQKIAQARDMMALTFVGLLVMFGSFALAGLVGVLFLGGADAILNPTLTGAGTC